MKLSRLVLPLVCLCTLTGCVSVSNEDFLTTAKNIEEHKFKYVTFNYYAETDTEKGEGTVLFTKRDSDGYYAADIESEASKACRQYLGFTASSVKLQDSFEDYEKNIKQNWDHYDVDFDIKYYCLPYKVVGTFDATYNDDVEYGDNGKYKVSSGSRNIDYTAKFEKYGNLSFVEMKMKEIKVTKKDGYVETLKTNAYLKITIEYKD